MNLEGNQIEADEESHEEAVLLRRHLFHNAFFILSTGLHDAIDVDRSSRPSKCSVVPFIVV